MKKFFGVLLLGMFAVASVAAETKLSFDAFSRARYEYLVNVFDAGLSGKDERSYFRFKFTAGLLADFNGAASAYLRIGNESRSYIHNAGGSTEYNINEFIIDNLYVTIPNIFDILELKIGRMDLPLNEYGEGFLIADGTPLEGSKSWYFNAVKAKLALSESSNVEFIGIYNTRIDDILPVANENTSPYTWPQPLNDSNERAFIIYARTGDKDTLYFEPYYMYKHEYAAGARLENEIDTFGSYIKYKINDEIVLRGQGAVQLNNYENEINTAFGG